MSGARHCNANLIVVHPCKQMKCFAETILAWLRAFGIDPLQTVAAFRGLPEFIRDYWRFRRALSREQGNPWALHFTLPCLQDRRAASGTARGHYFHQDLWVARRIYARNPERHIDVGSSIVGLIARLAVFRQVEVLDIRPQPARIPNVIFRQHDLMGPVGEYEACCDSLSCLHVLEHMGLGRYGDPVDPNGYMLAFQSLARMVKPKGVLYLSVPVGNPQRVEFNGHRVFAIQTILDMAKVAFDLSAFSWVDDAGDLHEEDQTGEASIPANVRYGCGIFELKRTPAKL
jgi:hypothetical protein